MKVEYFLEDEDFIINRDNHKKNKYIFKKREIKESFTLLELLSDEDRERLKALI